MENNVGMWKQEIMMMEIENEVFDSSETDLDYEFDAPRFFDFTAQQEQSLTQLPQPPERWFETAGTYPPSPFAANLVMNEEVAVANSNTVHLHPKPKVFQHFGSNSVNASEKMSGLFGGVHQNVVQPGMTFNSRTIGEGLNSKSKSAVVKRSSTLMKPTASQLAKQNRPPQIVGSRFQKVQQAHKKEISVANSLEIESQSTKRQKLEGGLLRKVGDVKQQANFVHKAPKKIVAADQNAGYSKPKITLPRVPELETFHRAQRTRPKNAAEAEHLTVAVPKFKARPINRKILNAPSLPLHKRTPARLPEFQEFHLKTSERAMQHTSATSSSTLPCNDSDKDFDKNAMFSGPQNRISNLRRPSVMGAPKHDGLDYSHGFKARPFNKKILSSKGDIGVFRNIKQETTVPMEFNFSTEKRLQHNPPIDLFSKLSLTSGAQSNSGSKVKPGPHFRVFKDLKENMGNSFHLDQKEKPFIFGEKQIQRGSEGCINEAGTILSPRRNLGIR